MPRIILCLAVCLPCAAGADDPAPVAVRIVTAEGKPAAEAKVWVYPYTGTAEKPAEPKPLVADADGKLSVPGAKDDKERSRQLFARDAAGRISWSWVGAPWQAATPENEITVVLVDNAERAGRLTT